MDVISIKTALMGYEKVGKTQILNTFLEKDFEEYYVQTIGGQLFSKELKLKPPNKVILDIWDIGGNPKYLNLSKIFIKNSDFGIIVYDPFRRETFDILEWYISTFQELNKNSCKAYT